MAITNGDLVGVSFCAFVIGGLTFGLWRDRVHDSDAYEELCPLVLAEASPSDSLAVFQEHEGCFEFVQREANR